jgi:hypothetical protein
LSLDKTEDKKTGETTYFKIQEINLALLLLNMDGMGQS